MARLRLEKGTELEFGVHYANLEQEQRLMNWDKFGSKAVKMTDDEDEDDEDEEEGGDGAYYY